MLFLNFDAIKRLEERVLKAMFQVHNKDLILSDYTFCNIIKKIISNVSRIVSSIFYYARFYVCVITTINIFASRFIFDTGSSKRFIQKTNSTFKKIY